MPVIYGSGPSGRIHRRRQSIHVPPEPAPRKRGRLCKRGKLCKQSKLCKPVVRSDGKRYPSASAAAREMGYCGWGSNITACCRGKRNLAFGFGWRYAGGEADA